MNIVRSWDLRPWTNTVIVLPGHFDLDRFDAMLPTEVMFMEEHIDGIFQRIGRAISKFEGGFYGYLPIIESKSNLGLAVLQTRHGAGDPYDWETIKMSVSVFKGMYMKSWMTYRFLFGQEFDEIDLQDLFPEKRVYIHYEER